MELILNDVIGKVKSNDIKMTYKRQKIIEILVENIDSHLSVEEVYYLCKERRINIALPTIYRTMDFLEKKAIVVKNHFGDGVAKYELFIKEKSNHHHLICKKCGKIIEISGLLPKNLKERLEEENQFVYDNHVLKIYGYCKECLN